jgi:heptosyltransferase-2
MDLIPPPRTSRPTALLHSGARLPARVWPLENFRHIADCLRKKNIPVQIACDPDQLAWWNDQGEKAVCPRNVHQLFDCIDQSGIFIGNCSGPGHLAAISGVPTFTVYGPSMHEWWVPMHPASEIFEGKACPYKPCSDYCRYERPFCLGDVKAADVWPRIEKFAAKHLSAAPATSFS